ncbi:M16 family metallopeptidase [Phorcysia thermohydrogeniphila]|uniref:Putative Zn-dependent peptidase n=1 Tax=Phorcysia thermohydrogeniphila TaxID=936138 RepID=A0A4R1GH39_9BACT|nr:pitrilysin family protein [Phorcysia thermohydrogeniphila]TCK06313.1 putative Zn-dependent peptidase [Phorcysia thermohydrogeniphila]
MKVVKLSNGVTVSVREREDLNSVTVSVWIRAGASYETDRTRGIAHFLEHMMFNGSKNLPAGAIDREVESLGGEINAATSYDYTYYYINLPYEHGKRALELIAELVLNPLLSEEMLQKEKPIVLEEIARSKDNPQEIFAEKFMEKLYRKAPYRFPILGFEETVKEFTAEDLRNFYESLYTPERITVSIAGKVESEEMFSVTEELFGSLKRNSEVKEPEEEKAVTVADEFTVTHPAVAVPNVLLGWRLPRASREDIYYEILDSLLSSGRSSLLYRRLKEKGLAYGVYSSYQNLLLGSNFYIVVITDRIDESRKALKDTLQEVLSISKEEFEFAKEKLYKGEMFARESGEAEADAIGYALTVMRDKDYYEKFFSDLKEANYKEFLKRVQFLQEEPLTGLLLPAR